jgi:hypothetical protein
VGVRGIPLRLLGGHEPEVVVAVRHLRGATGVHHVDLRRDLIARTQPGGRNQRQHVVRVIVGERRGIPQRELVQRSPDPVVGARLGEMIAAGHAGGLLLRDHREEDVGGAVHHVWRERALEHHDAGTARQSPGQFGGHLRARRPYHVCGVEQDIALHVGGVRIVAAIGLLLHDGAEVVEPAVGGGEPGRHALQARRALRQDLRRACHAILQAQRALPGPVRTNPSAIQVITPFNAPPVEF